MRLTVLRHAAKVPPPSAVAAMSAVRLCFDRPTGRSLTLLDMCKRNSQAMSHCLAFGWGPLELDGLNKQHYQL